MEEFKEGMYNAVRFDNKSKEWICKKVLINYRSEKYKFYVTITDESGICKTEYFKKLSQYIDVVPSSSNTFMYSSSLEYSEMKDMIIQKAASKVAEAEEQLAKMKDAIASMESKR